MRATRLELPALRTMVAALGIAVGLGALAQSRLGQPAAQPGTAQPAEYHFARLIYTDRPENRRFGGGWWMQDWPDAEVHFAQGIRRLTRIDAGSGVTVDLRGDEIFDYPWLYATQVGYWDLSEPEIDKLREYLLRGGFLMVDDFFGEYEWSVFQASMTRLFPERPILDIDSDTDEVLHVLYDVDKFTQIPGLRHLRGGRRGGGFGVQRLPNPYWRGIYDDDGRLMIAMNHNQDVGDAWEHADDPYYPEPMTALAYRFGINYIVYAMTH